MTDKETLVLMFSRIGAKLQTTKEAWGGILVEDNPNVLMHFDGYNGFFTEFIFNEDGSLKRVGAYE